MHHTNRQYVPIKGLDPPPQYIQSIAKPRQIKPSLPKNLIYESRVTHIAHRAPDSTAHVPRNVLIAKHQLLYKAARITLAEPRKQDIPRRRSAPVPKAPI